VIAGRKLGFTRRIMLLASKPAGTGGFLQLGAGRFDKKEDDLVKSERTAERVASHDDSRAAMPFAPVIEGELHFRADPEGPLRQQAYSLGRPVDLILNQVD
jgi:hypothetical protein